jgi:urease accessory protein
MIAETCAARPRHCALSDGEGETFAAVKTVETGKLEGYLELVCAADAAGRSYLARQSFRVPFHISKPYWNDHALLVQMVNPTPGLFSGDALRCEVRVESGARLHLTAPSASRIHTMRGGRAELDQKCFVARGGWLEFQPALLIPQRQCRYRQRTDIEVQTGGELFFIETFAPGRVAHGEAFSFTEVEWEFSLRYQQRLIARERFTLRPNDTSLAPLKTPFPSAYFATGYLVSDRVDVRHESWNQIRELNSASALVGISRLAGVGWSIKILGRDSIALNQTIQSIRLLLASALVGLHSKARNL